ncbi:hypothetical protein LTR53_008043 [Teratosphaeriaceae sp. CCFEE 6253]|nr:hypothetical protein LTR53_008043 [Teratosphaeriaceae sp. CCFEE 6253]
MSLDSLRRAREMSALEFLQEKPLPSIPSPTLTNPDMVLPFDDDVPAIPSPARSLRRPPSLSYFRDRANSEAREARSPGPKKEKRGLMSRKMMLLRSRTGSANTVHGVQPAQAIPRSVPSDSDGNSGYNSAYASSPTLMDVGNLAPEQVNENRLSFGASSFNSDEYAAIPSFLAKYESKDGAATDDESFDGDSPALKKYGYSVTIEGGVEAQRKQQEEDEHNSAILSRRAEQILANAKKRLNVMEGNLRGARDLVAPLTSANLKRATSLGSSHHSLYANRSHFPFERDGAGFPGARQPLRPLHAQASSPTMGRDFVGHARGYSDTSLPERPQTALGGSRNVLIKSRRIPVKTSEGSWTQSLRSSQSYDSFRGNNGGYHAVHERPLHARGSPDSNLEPLQEDEASHRAVSPGNSTFDTHDRQDVLRVSNRPASRADEVREQMTSLKGKISTLKERAREDSLRRQSLQNLRTPSPFSNAAASPPEYLYTQSPTYGSPVLDTNAGIGQVSQNTSPATPPRSPQKMWDPSHTMTGSRNAFAQQAAAQRQQSDGPASPRRTASTYPPIKQREGVDVPPPRKPHTRSQSGTAFIQPAANRYAHHRPTRSREMPGSYFQDEAEYQASPGAYEDDGVSPLPVDEPLTPDYEHVVSEEEDESVYEDAEDDPSPAVAHEDRDDAFNYEHFFLHSAMATNGNGRRASSSSSASSAETARGPTAAGPPEPDFDPGSSLFPPPTPETPERLREIERSLHRRTQSNDSVSTSASFATANDGTRSPERRPQQARAMASPMPPLDFTARPGSRPGSRPSTAIKRPDRRRNSSSERADSGIGMPRRSNSDHNSRKVPALTIASPPMSPRTAPAQIVHAHDPATVAVHALLDPHGRQLGPKDKAILFGLVESLRKAVQSLQHEDEGQYESRVLRRRLDEAKRALDGGAEAR